MTNVDAAAAVFALLTADTSLKVYDGTVPLDAQGKLPARPYVVQWTPPIPSASLDTLSGRSGWFEQAVSVTVVGDSAASVGIVARRVRAALLDVVPVVVGRVSLPIRMDGTPTSTQADQDVQPVVLYSVLRWACSSTPA